jgi:hypothetical protein
MDKSPEVSILLREREENIVQLEQHLRIWKKSVNKQAVEQLALQQNMEVLKISHEENIFVKNIQIQQVQEAMEKYRDVPSVYEFIKEALKLNSLLSKQKDLFFPKNVACHSLSNHQ